MLLGSGGGLKENKSVPGETNQEAAETIQMRSPKRRGGQGVTN